MPAVANFVHEITSSGGTGPLTLQRVVGRRRFSDAFSIGGADAFDIFASSRTSDEWQRGTGHLSDANTLVWDTISQSSNGGNPVNFTQGIIDLTNFVPAGKIVQTDLAQSLTNKEIIAPTGIVKGDVGLGNVDNTSDANKPISTATQAALDAKLANVAEDTTPELGGNLSANGHNITMTGSETVDGRDVSADGTKLDGIESGADVTDAGNVGSSVHGATAKTTLADADEFALIDSAASNVLKRITWANVYAAIWSVLGAVIAGGTSKATPIDADTLALSDSAASNATKKLTWANVKATLKTYFDTLYQPLASALTSWASVTRASGFDTFAATPSSANLRSLLTDETGTGLAYFQGGALGTPSSATLTNATGLPVAGITGTLPEANGGTNQSTYAQGDLLYASAANTLSKLAKNASSTRYLSNTGTNNNPAWAQVDLSNGVTGVLGVANLPNGAILQVLNTTYATNTNLGTTIPYDDTIPQSTEGVQVLSQAITPTDNTNKVLASLTLNGGNDASSSVIVAALFRGTTCIQAYPFTLGEAGQIKVISFDFLDSPATTSSTTYSVRVGANASNCRLNGDFTQRRMGGASTCSLTLMEIAA